MTREETDELYFWMMRERRKQLLGGEPVFVVTGIPRYLTCGYGAIDSLRRALAKGKDAV